MVLAYHQRLCHRSRHCFPNRQDEGDLVNTTVVTLFIVRLQQNTLVGDATDDDRTMMDTDGNGFILPRRSLLGCPLLEGVWHRDRQRRRQP